MRRIHRWDIARYLLVAPISYVGYLIAVKTLRYSNGDTREGLLIAKQAYLEAPGYLWSFYVHAFVSVLVLVLGLLQFWPRIYRWRPVWHRWIGRSYVLLVLLISAPAALWMSRFANGGYPSELAFGLQALLWWGTTALGWWWACKRNWSAHLKLMLYSYALALGAVSLRILAYVTPLLIETYPTETYIGNAWLSWVGNLLVLEVLLALGLQRHLQQRFFQG
ncbi:MAG: DUF2306 domain-containing protein [Bacteroidota bacterium]